ncbi:unnamed protein product [Medioppia subpectinata]|uniref:F-box domain-containing protein n=1 Tax=Medioppia subpectinata TaxID=1979941 RepID=A0A7R9KH42_9ACAR|nr:unnamed protein product [Medioppia subpectinata]CAG2103258.1 unnamed protein product [Medioppia subpectinata]
MAQQMTTTKTSLETTDDSNEDNRQQTQIYAKNSMDRFGDDLCQLLLYYLSLEDRFRLESVSKQFQRTVFESVVDITLNDKLINRFRYECVSKQFRRNIYKSVVNFKLNDKLIRKMPERYYPQMLATITTKCPNIEIIDCRRLESSRLSSHAPEMLHTFRDKCWHLRDIYCNPMLTNIKALHDLRPLVTRIGSKRRCGGRYVRHCERMFDLSVKSLSDVYSQKRVILTKRLRKLSFETYDGVNGANNEVLAVIAFNNKSLTCLAIRDLKPPSIEIMNEFADVLSQRLPQLRKLTLHFDVTDIQYSIDGSLSAIAVKCKQLKRLSLVLQSKSKQPVVQTLHSLPYFSQLKRLLINLYPTVSSFQFLSYQFVDPLRLCRRLTHLSLQFSQINPNILDNCHTYWPRLQYLFIKSAVMTGDCLSHISRLPALQTLVIHLSKDVDLSDNNYEDLLFRSYFNVLEFRVCGQQILEMMIIESMIGANDKCLQRQ